MFDTLKTLFGSQESETTPELKFGPDDIRLATAALMFHVISADGIITNDERERMHAILETEYELSKEEVAELYAAAHTADSEAIDLYRFTSTLKRQLEPEARIEVVEHLWEMVFADGILHELEDHVVWRIAELLEVERNDRIALKQRVRARTGVKSGDQGGNT